MFENNNRYNFFLKSLILTILLSFSSVLAAKPYQVVVLPFDKSAELKYELPELIEFELELNERVVVKSSKRTWANLSKYGWKKFYRKNLSRVMRKRHVDIVLAGRVVKTKKGRELEVFAYSQDGRMRFLAVLPFSKTMKKMSKRIVKLFNKKLIYWKKLKVVKSKRWPRYTSTNKSGSEQKKDNVYLAKKRSSKKKEEPGFFEGTSNWFTGSSKKKDGKSKSDDGSDFWGSKTDKQPNEKLTHFIRLSVLGGGNSWFYDLKTIDPEQQSKEMWAQFYGGAMLDADLWVFPWLGVDANVRVGYVPFCIGKKGFLPGDCIEDQNSVVIPRQFASWKTHAQTALKLRYVYENPSFMLAGGVRLGYRFSSSYVDYQIHRDDNKLITLVPGFQWHQSVIGLEGYTAFRLFGKRLEMEAKIDAVPAVPPFSLSKYTEAPDSPGKNWWVVGWSGSLASRMLLSDVFFIEGQIFHNGAYVEYTQTGNRLGFKISEDGLSRERITGGNVVNIDGGFGIGGGISF